MTEHGEAAADTARTAARVEDRCAARRHRVDEACFTVEIVPGGGHCTEPFDVPVRMVRVLLDRL